MLRKLAKAGVAAGMHRLGMDRIVGAGRRMQDLPLVLNYHRVVENYERSAMHSIAPMLVSAATFEAQLDWIGRHYEFVTLDELASSLDSEQRLRKPVAAVTFDDGYGDTYYNAFPILKRKGIPMAVFVVTDLVGTTRLQIHDYLHLLLTTALAQWPEPAGQVRALGAQIDMDPLIVDRLCACVQAPFRFTRLCLELLQQAQLERFIALLAENVEISAESFHEFHALSWDMLKHMVTRGATVGSHTKSHTLLANESRDKMLDEIKGSREELERRLGKSIRHFAYPDGRFNAEALDAVAEAGYRYAYTTCMHRDKKQPMLTIPRRVLWENSCVDGFGRFSPSILSCQINGIFDPARRCDQTH